MSEILGTGIAFPLRVDPRGGLALVRGDDDVREAILLILGTAFGERPMRPEFGCGIHDLVFDSVDAHMLGRVEHEIRMSLDRWEPRIEVEDLDFDLSRMDEGALLIDISYTLRPTNETRNLVYPFYVIPVEEL